MKTLLLAAAFATVMALPAFAEVTNATTAADAAARPHGQFREEHKNMREGFKADRQAMHQEHKGEAEAAREDCHKRIEAAQGPDAKEAIVKDCRAKADTMRKQFYDERTKEIADHRAQEDKMMGDMRAKHEEMKAKRDVMKPAAQ